MEFADGYTKTCVDIANYVPARKNTSNAPLMLRGRRQFPFGHVEVSVIGRNLVCTAKSGFGRNNYASVRLFHSKSGECDTYGPITKAMYQCKLLNEDEPFSCTYDCFCPWNRCGRLYIMIHPMYALHYGIHFCEIIQKGVA